MGHRITDPTSAKKIQMELEKVISYTQTFASHLKTLLRKHEIDVDAERKATVEVLQIILQKWVVEIIHVLFINDSLRFNEIRRRLKGISSRTLTSKLRILEDKEFVKREVVRERPTVVEYKLTEKGHIIAELSTPIITYLKLESLKTS